MAHSFRAMTVLKSTDTLPLTPRSRRTLRGESRVDWLGAKPMMSSAGVVHRAESATNRCRRQPNLNARSAVFLKTLRGATDGGNRRSTGRLTPLISSPL